MSMKINFCLTNSPLVFATRLYDVFTLQGFDENIQT